MALGNMDSKHKHLELIQGVINRFSTNSFLLKGWSVVLVSALFALSAPNSRVEFVYLAYIPAIIFWGLDGFFLWQEQLFRKLYDRVRVLPDDEVDFSMNTSVIKGDDRPGWSRTSSRARWSTARISHKPSHTRREPACRRSSDSGLR